MTTGSRRSGLPSLEAGAFAGGRERFLILAGRMTLHVVPRLLHPLGRAGVADQVQEPPKHHQAVSAPEAEQGGTGRDRVCDRRRSVMAGPDGIGDHAGYGLRILPVVQKISSDPGWPGDGQAANDSPFIRANHPRMEADVWPTGLPTSRKREFMPVRRKVAKAVQRRGGAVRDHPLLRLPVPGRNLRSELKPGGPQVEMIRGRRPSQSVDTMSHPVENATRGQPLQGSRRDTSLLSLPTGHEAPLILSDRRQAAEGR
jgi:hypothetical protein